MTQMFFTRTPPGEEARKGSQAGKWSDDTTSDSRLCAPGGGRRVDGPCARLVWLRREYVYLSGSQRSFPVCDLRHLSRVNPREYTSSRQYLSAKHAGALYGNHTASRLRNSGHPFPVGEGRQRPLTHQCHCPREAHPALVPGEHNLAALGGRAG